VFARKGPVEGVPCVDQMGATVGGNLEGSPVFGPINGFPCVGYPRWVPCTGSDGGVTSGKAVKEVH
jgi:hypothetical protein